MILASSSRYRAELLNRLKVPFIARAPDLDETPRRNESPANLAQRLALEKAQALSKEHPDLWVLGSDQVASLEGRIIRKPGTRAKARKQLQKFSGHSLVFYTAIALINGRKSFAALDTTIVRFRAVTTTEIDRYLDVEPAYDCAGSFKCEGLGISLFEAIETRDPSALIGLPLIAVRRLLSQAGYSVP